MTRLVLLAFLLAACKSEDVAAPDPVTMNADALGHFCQMQLISHPGPKAQIHLKGLPDPIFFSQVRDALAYMKGPERDADVVAFYVSDMSAAPDWENPGNDNWMAASQAQFVVGADVRGGMGAPEIVPFSDPVDAKAFAAESGGSLMQLEAIPAETVLAPVDIVLDDKTQP